MGGIQKLTEMLGLRIYAHEIGDEFDFADGRRIRLHRAGTEAWMRQASNCSAQLN